jgi:hypothetical protein
MTLPKFPRRYAQRRDLPFRHGRATTSPEGPSSRQCTWEYKPSKTKLRSARASKTKVSPPNASSHSNSLSDDESEFDCESDQDSGYSTSSSRDAKAEYYWQKTAQFAAEGPTMSDPGDKAKAMMRAEEEKWNL